MSEPESAAPAAAEAAAPPSAHGAETKKEATKKEAKKKAPSGAAGPKAPVLIGIIAGALLVGGGVGFALIGPRVVAARTPAAAQGKDAHSKGKKEKKKGGGHGEEKSVAFRIDNLIVNPAGSRGTRFLMTTVAVQASDEQLLKALDEHEDQARDIVIATLESHTMEMLTRPGARDSLKAHIALALTPLATADYEPDPKAHDHAPPELSVFLPQFVIQ